MNKITLYCHVGMAKTGSSVIQNFLDVNRENLYRYHSCLYPNFGARKFHTGRCHNHDLWYRENENNQQVTLKKISEVIRYCEAHGISKIVMSSEAWLGDRSVPDLMRKIQDSFDFVEIKTICYLRRVDSWFESAWKQWGLKKYKSIEEYLQEPTKNQRYKAIWESLEYWSNQIGEKNILIRPYEKEQLRNGILADFVQCLGIDYDSFDWKKNEETNLALNIGFNRDVLEVLFLCQELYTDRHDNHLFELFSNLLGEHFQKKPFDSYSLLSPAQRLEIITNNLPYENLIARKYLNRPDGRIFYEPLPNLEDPWQPYSGLTLDKAIPIIVQLIEETNRQIKENQLSHKLRRMKILQPFIKFLRWVRRNF